MKKMSLFVAGLGVLAGLTVQAANTNVTSVNAVGFMKVTLPASNKFVMVSSSFLPVGGGPRTLESIFGSGCGLRQSTTPARVDRVYVWDLANQRYLILGQKTNGLFYQTSAWTSPSTNPVVPLGYGFFVQSPTASNGGTNDTTITMIGEVPAMATNAMSILGATPTMPFQLIGNPYPVTKTIDELINVNSGAKGSSSPATCDRVYLWDTVAQRYIILGLKTPTNRWYFTSAWTTNNMPVYTIEPGKGFWYQGRTNFTWNAEKPYLWP